MKTASKYRKSNLLSQKQKEALIVDSASKANLLMTIYILHDCYGFGKKRLQDFVDKYKMMVDSCENGVDDWRKLNDEVWKRFGIKVI